MAVETYRSNIYTTIIRGGTTTSSFVTDTTITSTLSPGVASTIITTGVGSDGWYITTIFGYVTIYVDPYGSTFSNIIRTASIPSASATGVPTVSYPPSTTSAGTAATGASTLHGPGISTGAIAGIAVGCVVVGIAIIACLVFYLKKHLKIPWHRQPKTAIVEQAPTDEESQDKPELPSHPTTKSMTRFEKRELFTDANRHELGVSGTLSRPGTNEEPAELPGWYDKEQNRAVTKL